MATISDHTDERPELPNEGPSVAEENKEDLAELITEQSDTQDANVFDKVDAKKVQEAVDATTKQAEDKPVDQPATPKEDTAQPVQQEGEDNAAFQKRVLEAYSQESNKDNTEEVERLRRELEFYRLLNGDPSQQQQPQQQVQPQPQQQQPPQQVIQNAAVQALDLVNVTDDELLGFISGDRERALPVIKKFVATAAVVAMQTMQRQNEAAQRTSMYVEGVRKDFHDRFEDLRDYPEIVRAVGNDIGNSYIRRGIAKMPHELLDEVATRTREVIAKFKNGGGSNSPTPVRGSRQGNAGGGTRPAPVRQDNLTPEQKEMMDLLND